METLWEAFGLEDELDKLQVNSEKKEGKNKNSKKSVKQKTVEKAAMNKKLEKSGVQKNSNTASKAEHVSGHFKLSQINFETKMWLTVTREEYKISDLLPAYFHPDGTPLLKGQKPYSDEEIRMGIFRDDLSSEDTESEKTGTSDENQNIDEKKEKTDPTAKKTNSMTEIAISVNVLRKRLSQEFPQFSSTAMTQFYFDQKVNAIHVIIQPQRKGAMLPSRNGEENNHDLPFNMSDLLPKKFEKRELSVFLEAAKHVYLVEGAEVQYDIYYDHETDGYILDEPFQRRSRIFVDPEPNFEMQIKYQFIGSIHSHHVFEPNPSWQDDLSEKTFHIYGILGNFDELNEESINEYDENFINDQNVTFRTFFEDKFFSLPFSSVVNCE